MEYRCKKPIGAQCPCDKPVCEEVTVSDCMALGCEYLCDADGDRIKNSL